MKVLEGVKAMDTKDFAQVAINLHEDACYIINMETYELLYLNNKAKKLFGLEQRNCFGGHKCYSIFHGKNEPCEFCRNENLKEGIFCCEDFYYEKLDKYFNLKNTTATIDGIHARVVYCKDISENHLKLQNMKMQINVEEVAMECIRILISEKNTDAAIHKLLSMIAIFYGAERGYIFEFYDRITGKMMDNTYEWCKEGIPSEQAMLQNLPVDILSRWMKEFDEKGAFYVSIWDEKIDADSEEYKTLKMQGVDSLIAAPMKGENGYVGFIGVDNPTIHTEYCLLIQMLTSFVLEELEKRRMMDKLEQMSYYDEMTGVGNRNCYIKVIDELQKNPPKKLGILYIDINGLKKANDLYGHEHGDHIIRCTAAILKKYFSGELFRIGGDEFVSINYEIDKEQFEENIIKLRKQLEKEQSFGISIGSDWKEDGRNINKQIRNADELMYVDKQNYYERLLDGEQSHQSGATKLLIKEIANNQFIVYLQPKVSLETRSIIGAEALVRKKDLGGKMIPPDKFIPIYETEGIIRHVDFFVLRTVCKMLKDWMEEGIKIPISVNLSRITLMEYDIVNSVKKVCDEYKTPYDMIELEVTESTSKVDAALFLQRMNKFKEEGFYLSLDDFGTQYSNLSILSTFDFDEIKLDKSLIEHLDKNSRGNIIVEHTIDMCHSFDKTKSLAEGIETLEQENMLKEFHCDLGQGYLFSKPVSIEEFKRLYQKHSIISN